MPLPDGLRDVARAYYRRQARIARMAQEAARQVWRAVQVADLDRSWGRVAEQMTVTVAAAQLLAAQGAEPYVAEVLAEQGAPNDRQGTFQPRSLAGVASDGRPLNTLLLAPVVEVKQALAAPPVPVEEAMARGEATLLRVVGTQVPDAGRVAVGVVIAATPSVMWWVRMIQPGACGRCAILAGRLYRYNRGFERHPACMCTMIPLAEDIPNDVTTSPRKYFESLTRAEQNRLFGKARTERILNGEDLNRVVNSGRRSTRTAGGKPKRAAATPAGRSRTARSARARRTPEQILEATTSREEAIEQLRRGGFLTGGPGAAVPTRPAIVVSAQPGSATRALPDVPVEVPSSTASDGADRKALDEFLRGDGLTARPATTAGGRSPDHEAFLERFTEEARPEHAGMSAYVRIVTDPNTGQRMIYKRTDDAEEAEAEVLGALIGRAVGADVPRVWRLDDDAVAMEFIDGRTAAAEVTRRGLDEDAMRAWFARPEGARIAVMDYIGENRDRNPGNAMVGDDGLLWGIDHGNLLPMFEKHGLTPPPDDEMTRSEFGARPWERPEVTAAMLDEIEPRLAALGPECERVGGDAVERHGRVMRRLELLRGEVDRRDAKEAEARDRADKAEARDQAAARDKAAWEEAARGAAVRGEQADPGVRAGGGGDAGRAAGVGGDRSGQGGSGRPVSGEGAASVERVEQRVPDRPTEPRRVERLSPAATTERVDANAARVDTAVNDALADALEAMGKGGVNPDRLSAKDRGRLVWKLRGPAGVKVKQGIQRFLDEQYPTASRADRDEFTRSVMRGLTSRLDTPGRSPRGRGTQLAVRALERKTAFRDSGSDHRAAVDEARAVIGDPNKFGRLRPGEGLNLDADQADPRDGEPSEELLAKVEAIRAAGAAVSAAVDDLLKDKPDGGTPAERAQARRDVLGQVREMGPKGDQALLVAYKAMSAEDQARLEPLFARAEHSYPTDWLVTNRARGTIGVTRGERGAWYNPGSHEMEASTDDDLAKQEDAIIHELGHSMETTRPWIMLAEQVYLRARTSSGKVGSRKRDKPSKAKGADTQEEDYPDDFPTAYSGKVYNITRLHELLTTGIESLMGPGGKSHPDADLEQFVLGMLAVL